MTSRMTQPIALQIHPARARVLFIETPEGVAFSFPLATPVTRSLAWAIDAAAIGGISYTAGKVCQILGVLGPDWAKALSAILYFAVSIGYGIAMEWRWRGQTIGKRLLGLRVIDAHGMRLHLPQIALRNLLRENFRAHLPYRFHRGPHVEQASVAAILSKGSIFGEKAVARVDRIRATGAGDVE